MVEAKQVKKVAPKRVKKPKDGATKKPKRVVPKMIKKLLVHHRTRPLWARIKRSAKKKGVKPETLVKRMPKFIVKPVGGDSNGGKRLVRVKKEQRYYPTEPKHKKRYMGKITYKMHKRSYKKGICPGRVVILLAGRHKGKRVVVLKTLPSGMLMVTGPHKLNGCPLRRMHQMFTIVTSVKLDVSNVKIPEHVNDKYFRNRKNLRTKGKAKKGEGDIFKSKQKSYKPSFVHRKDQVDVDKQLIDVIRKHPEKKLMLAYLGSYFTLRNRMYPHKLRF